MARSITASNAVFTLAVLGVAPAPVQIKEFSADEVFQTDPLEPTEVQMGIDGVMSAGYVYVPVKQGITLQANSPSCAFFDLWWSAQNTQGDQFFAEGGIYLPSINSKWVMLGGALSTMPPIPDAGKTLKPRKFMITWERVQRVPF